MAKDIVPRDAVTLQAVMVTLQPIAMVRPNRAGVYAPSNLRPQVKMTQAAFLVRFALRSRYMLVSYASDGVSDPLPVLVFGTGLDCWFILAGAA